MTTYHANAYNRTTFNYEQNQSKETLAGDIKRQSTKIRLLCQKNKLCVNMYLLLEKETDLNNLFSCK